MLNPDFYPEYDRNHTRYVKPKVYGENRRCVVCNCTLRSTNPRNTCAQHSPLTFPPKDSKIDGSKPKTGAIVKDRILSIGRNKLANMTSDEVANQIGCAVSYVQAIANRHGVKLKRRIHKKDLKKDQAEKVLQLYASGKPKLQIARELGIT